MLGLELPDVDVWSERVTVALGQNPSVFTGPGTNTYLIGTGRRRLLLDPGEGRPSYLPVLERALERAGCEGIEAVVLTHGHADHIGGVRSVLDRFGEVPVWKRPWPAFDERRGLALREIDHGSVVETEGATLRALHTPGHAPDHLCFVLEEERALFSGDNVLGVGTTVIPLESGDLGDYMASLERMLAEAPGRIYPAHGPRIEDGPGKIREYIAHRRAREAEILAQLGAAPRSVAEIVAKVYAAYPVSLHAAAAQSTGQHLRKLEREGRARREGGSDALSALWRLP
jgi:glyoxylase-like metal-dependent hydrolase (beta-lactamase superfamily II)